MTEQLGPSGSGRQDARSRRATGGVALALATVMLAPMAVGAQSVEAPRAAAMPEILRGSVAAPPAVQPAAGPASDALDGQALAGDRFWMVNNERGKLVACRLVNTSQVGGQYIRCSERRLPHGARVAD